jgi:excisionase family DNA binding protein
VNLHNTPQNTSNAPVTGLEPLLSVDQLADYLGVPVKTVYDWRRTGHRPAAYRVGRFLGYAVSDVQAWLAEQRDTSSTSTTSAASGR